MPNLLARSFSSPELFRRLQPGLLLDWLRPVAGYLEKRGVSLPPAGDHTGTGLDYDALARVFLEPDESLPARLAEELYLVHEMGRPRRLASMLEAAAAGGLELGLPEEATPVDVALKLLLLDPGLLEELHHCGEMTRARGFHYFAAALQPPPPLAAPSLEQLRQLEERLDRFYEAWRGGRGTRVFAYCQQRWWQNSPEWLFLTRHGAPFRREETLENGQPGCVLFRPRKSAILRYDTARGEMGVYCESAREQRALLRAFGSCLFGQADFFPCAEKFDLRPLVELGREALACADVPGIAEVRLTNLEFYQRREPWLRTIKESDDLFTLLERKELAWPARVEEITRAGFTVRLRQHQRLRRVTIMPSNRALYTRDEDSALLDRWMQARGFTSAPRW